MTNDEDQSGRTKDANRARTTGAALEAHYRFVLWLVPTVERFPRKQKFLLGERIQATALDVLEHLIEATYTRQRTKASPRSRRCSRRSCVPRGASEASRAWRHSSPAWRLNSYDWSGNCKVAAIDRGGTRRPKIFDPKHRIVSGWARERTAPSRPTRDSATATAMSCVAIYTAIFSRSITRSSSATCGARIACERTLRSNAGRTTAVARRKRAPLLRPPARSA